MQLPIVHLNGTSHRELTEGYEAAYRSVLAAVDSVRGIEFNARDYYPAGPEAWETATNERFEVLGKLAEVERFLVEHLKHLASLKR